MQTQLQPKQQEIILEKLYSGEITSEDALTRLTPEPEFKGLKKARFVKIKIDLPNESRKLNFFLKALLSIPLPIGLAKLGVRLMNKSVKKGALSQKALANAPEDKKAEITEKMKSAETSLNDFDFNELYNYLRYAKNTTIDIDSNDAKIKIKIR